jgi:hypothetical protein
MYTQAWHNQTDLAGHLRTWLHYNSGWYLRQDQPDDDDQFAIFWTPPPLRHASPEEIAADIVNDPALREALGFLTSRDGQLIEDAVLQQWLSDSEAQLLTGALTQAWQIVLNQNRPVWQRTEVLVGVGVGAIALLALASRGKS